MYAWGSAGCTHIVVAVGDIRGRRPRLPDDLDKGVHPMSTNNPGALGTTIGFYGLDAVADEGCGVGEAVVTARSSSGFAVVVPESVELLPIGARVHVYRLIHLLRESRLVSGEIDELVPVMRADGVPWGVIGWCVGMSAQAARERWAAS